MERDLTDQEEHADQDFEEEINRTQPEEGLSSTMVEERTPIPQIGGGGGT